MWETLIGIVVKSLSDSLLLTVADFIKAEMQSRQLIQQGQSQQAAAETAASLATETRIAAAEANTDTSADGMAAAARKGVF